MAGVLLITDFFRPEPGGLESLFLGLARHWKPQEMDVLVTSSDRHYLYSAVERSRFDRGESYPIVRLLPRSGSLFRREPVRIVGSYMEGLLRRNVYSHYLIGNLSPSTLAALGKIQRMGLPYSIFINGADLLNRLGFWHYRERHYLRGARNLFALSRNIRRSLLDIPIAAERITVIPPAAASIAELQKVRRNRTLSPAEARWGDLSFKDRFVILGVGPFLPRKGFDRAVALMERLRGEAFHPHLVLAGSGPEFAYIQELVRIRGLGSSITLAGFVTDEELASLYRMGHLFLQPGCEREDDLEGMSVALMEAASFGLPAIAGAVGGIEDLLHDGETGFLVRPTDVDAMADRVRELAGSTALRSRMGRNAKALARGFDVKRTVDLIRSKILNPSA